MTDLILRDYQTDDVERLRASYGSGHRAPIYQLATGGGKTVVFSHITKSAAAKGKRTGVFVHRRELIKQSSAKLDWAGVPHGIMAAGQDRDHDAPVQVLSIQSAVRRELPQFDFIVIDEAHHARADTWHQLLASQTKAKLLGVTATPARTDGKGLGVDHGGLFDDMICGPSMQSLIDQGHLSPARCLVPSRTIDTSGLKKLGGDYQIDELAKRAKIVTGDAVAEYAKHAAGKSAIAFCCTIEHAEDVAQAFTDAGFRAACVHGGTPKDIRADLQPGNRRHRRADRLRPDLRGPGRAVGRCHHPASPHGLADPVPAANRAWDAPGTRQGRADRAGPRGQHREAWPTRGRPGLDISGRREEGRAEEGR
jgi:superfamily II DNA or RNA helicase